MSSSSDNVLERATKAYQDVTRLPENSQQHADTLRRIFDTLDKSPPASNVFSLSQWKRWLPVLAFGGLGLAFAAPPLLRAMAKYQETQPKVQVHKSVNKTTVVSPPPAVTPPPAPIAQPAPKLPSTPKAMTQPAAKTPTVAPAEAPEQDRAQQEFDEALHLQFKQQQAERAAEKWALFLEKHPQHALAMEARFHLGRALGQACQLTRARAVFEPFLAGDFGQLRQERAQALLQEAQKNCPPSRWP